jgi:two-component system chemotaxis sensor kinase CheA
VRKRETEVGAGLVDVLLAAHDALRAMLVVVASRGTVELGPYEPLIERLSRAARGEVVDAGRPMAPAGRGPRRTLRVDLGTLDRILTHTGELSVALARLRTTTNEASDVLADVERLFGDLREHVMRIRLVPVGPMFRQQIRAVRDIAAASEKHAQLVIEGEDVEVDTAVVDLLRDPLTHMIRNAIDHAIESPDMRAAAGKSRVATIRLRARHEGSQIVIEVCDDGAGFHREKILARARAMGLATAAAERDESELYKLVFAPGFSTADDVTKLSGRGVGLDVVARNVIAMKGTIAVHSVEGKGATVSVRVPLTLAMISGFAVGIAEDTFVIPMAAVRECVELPPEGTRRGMIGLRGDALPYVPLRHVLGVDGLRPPHEDLVVVEHDGQRAGLAVDRLIGEMHAVVQPLSALLRGADGISGSTILGDGRVGLILDVPAILRDVSARSIQ